MPLNIADLIRASKYELYFLADVFRLSGLDSLPPVAVHMEYAPDGSPLRKVYGQGFVGLNDWRPGFLAAGAPLAFVTAFKLLDAVVEWLLQGTLSSAIPTAFKDKAAKLEGIDESKLPELFSRRPWLWHAMIGLYTTGYPLRNTVIHNSEFDLHPDAFSVQPSRSPGKGRATISRTILRQFAECVFTVARALVENRALSEYREKHLKWLLDQIQALHGRPFLGQRRPQLGLVRIESQCTDRIEFYLPKLQLDVDGDPQNEHLYLQTETLFDLEIRISEPDGVGATYLVPWQTLQEYPDGMDRSEVESFLKTTEG